MRKLPLEMILNLLLPVQFVTKRDFVDKVRLNIRQGANDGTNANKQRKQ